MSADRIATMIPPLPNDEAQRIEALRRYEQLDASIDLALQDLTRLAAEICQTPIAAIALLTSESYSVHSQVGSTEIASPLHSSLFFHTLDRQEAFIVADTAGDPRFATLAPLPHPSASRFYAGIPLIGAEGYAIGVLAIMDPLPRPMNPNHPETLQTLGRQVMALLELHRLQMPQKHQPHLPDFLDRTHDLIQTFSLKDQRLQYVNSAWQESVGYSPAEIDALSLWDILDPDSCQTASRLLEKLSVGESINAVELIFLTKTGDRLWVEGSLSCDRESNHPTDAIGIFRNITAEKQAHLQYEQLFENTALGLFQLDLSGRYSQINSALAQIYGYLSPAEFLCVVEHISQLYLHPNDWIACRHLLETQTQVVHEVEVKRRDGTSIWLSENIRLLRDIRGRAIGYEGFVQDVTRSKQAEATVQLARDQLQAVLDAVPGTVSLISADFHYLGVNRHLAATYNLPLAQFVGREVGFRQSAFGKFVRDFFANSASEAAIEIDSEVNGSFRSDLVIAKKWLEDKAAVFVGIDITERKRAEAALKAELAEAAEYVRSLLPLPFTDSVAIDSRFIPSQQLGGDCFDYYWLDDDHLAIYLLDVSGHGSRAALLSVSVLNLLRARFLPDTDFYQPSQVLTALNHAIQMERQRNMYFTIWYGVYNRRQRQLVYACAGHPPAILLSSEMPVQKLRTETSLPIGMFPNVKYANASCAIAPDSTLYIFSDGIYEIYQPDGTMWQLDNFIELLAHCDRLDSFNLERVLSSVRQVSAKDTFDDDVSLLQVKFPE